MTAPAVDNPTDFAAHPQVLVDKDGERLVCIVKATYERDPGGALFIAPKGRRRGIRGADVPWGLPEMSSILYPGDLFLRKPGTDVIVVAKAYAPGGRPVPSFDCAVKVGALSKIVRVFGLRVWQGGGSGLSAPRPIAECEVRYDYAWGGVDGEGPSFVEEARNPVGMGVARDSSSLTHKPGPSLEDPLSPIMSASTRPPPAGFGAIGRHWEPRRSFMGTWDKKWVEERAPLVPLDFDDRANLCASPGLTATPPLKGGEDVALLNLTPGGGTIAFTLPRTSMELEFRVKDRAPETLRPYLDTVIIDSLDADLRPLTVECVWRASVRAPRPGTPSTVRVRAREPK